VVDNVSIAASSSSVSAPAISFQVEDAVAVVHLAGDWSFSQRLKRAQGAPQVETILADTTVTQVVFDSSQLGATDGRLHGWLWDLWQAAQVAKIPVDLTGLPPGERQLLEVAAAAPQREASGEPQQQGWLSQLGRWTQSNASGALEVVDFTGEWVGRLFVLLSGRGVMRWKDFWKVMQQVSADALPIVTLISFLVGLIIAFLGAVVLMRFGAEFAVAYLVGYGMLREMGAVMTGVIMAGRTGAAFAAQLGSMKVNEELDALSTFGISPMDFLVVPRIIALTIMMPLLVIYANVVGIFSGYLVADGLMGVPPSIFFSEMTFVVGLPDLFLGIFKGLVFGLLVATSGCLRGLQSGSGADAVGEAATKAVVTGITLIIFANAVIDWAAATLQI